MNPMNPQVDGYVRKHKKWEAELQTLRKIVLASPLKEEVKWRAPVYTSDGRNIIFLGAFKEFCAISFIKGVLLKDPKKILQLPGPHSQAVRIVKFTELSQIKSLASTLKGYIKEAIAIENSGVKIELIKISDRPVPEELQAKLEESPRLMEAFESLTPGRRRGYLMFVGSAKQAATRVARVEKCIPKILAGKGIDE